jgi:phytanoyl-CoA hydroxylase
MSVSNIARQAWTDIAARLGRGPVDTPLTQRLWLDEPDAAQIVSTAAISETTRAALLDLITKGFTIIREAQDPALCEAAIADYDQYVSENAAYVAENLDGLGREKRLVNFHHYSPAAQKLGLNPKVLEILDYAFGSEAGIYTSLTFKYGTQQPVHRDTPHFATWPDGYFMGVWTALEDITPESGPLFYYEGAHRFEIDAAEIWREAQALYPDSPEHEQLSRALDRYNGRVIENAPLHGVRREAPMRRGDVAIWHPKSPHGGSPAADPMRTRWSIVFHCAPRAKQVHQHESYFRHAGRQEPAPRYGFREAEDRAIAVAGDVAYM